MTSVQDYSLTLVKSSANTHIHCSLFSGFGLCKGKMQEGGYKKQQKKVGKQNSKETQ